MWVDGIVGLLVESSLEEAVGDGSLACASVLASPEASKLGGLDCVARHGKLEKMSAREDCSGEGRSVAENWPSSFEDLFIQGLQVEGRWRNKLAGIREPRDEGTL